VTRLLPATEHTAWLGAHAPGALLPRASWTTGVWASSSRRLFGMLGCPGRLRGCPQVVGPPRPVSVLSGTRPGSPRPPQRARPASQASSLCGGNPSRRKAGIAVRGCPGQHRIPQIEQEGQTTHKSAGRHAQQCVWHAGLCGTSVRSQLTIFFIANGRGRRRKEG